MSCCTAPCFHVLTLCDGALELGRDELARLHLDDPHASRRHLALRHTGSTWTLEDRGSTNGTFIDGQALHGRRQFAEPRVVRLGQTLLLPRDDVTDHALLGMDADGEYVIGPSLRSVHEHIARIARAGQNLLLAGPSGTGKEVAARHFHEACHGPDRERPFVALNCATIPEGVAERVLFGARRGAYSGADRDATGLLQEADGGTLFLDEIAELSPALQAKLLRALEIGEILPVGAVKPVTTNFALCVASHEDLRARVAAGSFREDLYFRVGRPALTLPSLGERAEEIPWLIQRALDSIAGELSLAADPELIEACLLRAWPGNVRELLIELRAAAILGLDLGRVSLADLSPDAGRRIGVPHSAPTSVYESDPVYAALLAHRGNVSRAASELGISRSKIRRHVDKHSIDLLALRGR